jgi:hypothetical protein
MREVLDRHDLHTARKVTKSPAKRCDDTKHRSSYGRSDQGLSTSFVSSFVEDAASFSAILTSLYFTLSSFLMKKKKKNYTKIKGPPLEKSYFDHDIF